MPQDLTAELRQIVRGEVLSDDKSLEHYSKDGSIFTLKPWAVVLPSSKEDIKNLVKWIDKMKANLMTSQVHRACDVQKLSVTCRGKGTDQAGGPINEGIIVRFPGYLDKILEIKPDSVTVEPGILWGELNKKLEIEQNRFVPCYPASANFSTLGGAAANNCSGEKTVKYGSIREWIISLKMILADGSETEFKKLSAEEVIRKQTQDNLEGGIYRKISDLLVSRYNLIQNSKLAVSKNSTGYWLYDLIDEDGSFNLHRLICGSQGTLGIITEITLRTASRPKASGLLLASFNKLEKAGEAVPKILKFKPSALEMIDKFLIEMERKINPEMTAPFAKSHKTIPEIVLFIEFEGETKNAVTEKIEAAKKNLNGLSDDLAEAYDPKEKNLLWQTRRSAAIVAEGGKGRKQALPFIEDSVVHPLKLAGYLKELYGIMRKHKVEFSVWGHAGDGNVHIQPFLDLGDPKDAEKLFKMAEEVYDLVVRLGGALSGEHNDGLMRLPFFKKQFNPQMIQTFKDVKEIFDPLCVFNPRKKTHLDLESVKKHLRKEYEVEIAGHPIS